MKARQPPARQARARLSMAEIERRLSVLGSVRSTNLPACGSATKRRPNPRKGG